MSDPARDILLSIGVVTAVGFAVAIWIVLIVRIAFNFLMSHSKRNTDTFFAQIEEYRRDFS